MRRTVLPAVAAAVLLVAGCGAKPNPAVTDGPLPGQSAGAGEGSGHGGDSAPGAGGETSSDGPGAAAEVLYSGEIKDAKGVKVGTVAVSKAEQGMSVHVTATGMPPGFHASHLHAVGKCEPKSPDPADSAKVGDFLSAGGHLAGTGTAHPEHAGDLPLLYVGADGTGSLTATTDRLTEELLGQAAGVSMVVHAGADNYGNIPTRYASGGADAETKKAGDAGARLACGVLAKGDAAAH